MNNSYDDGVYTTMISSDGTVNGYDPQPPVSRIVRSTADGSGSELIDYLQKNVPQKRTLHPMLVLLLIIVCFPIGLLCMLFFTKWGAFPKLLICCFVLGVALAIFEILVAKDVLALPSIIETFRLAFEQFSA